MRSSKAGSGSFSRRIHAQVRLAGTRLKKLMRLSRHREYWPALGKGVAASVEHSTIPFREDIRTVLDVGASRGQFAVFAAARFPDARIICFEPLEGPLADLREVMGARVETRPVALGAAPGAASMNVSRRDDSSSILPIGERQVGEFPGTGAVTSVDVEITTLDEAIGGTIDRPCLLKIDVQGLELEVLRGAADTLGQTDEALIECSFVELYEGQALADEVIDHLLGLGLRLAGVHGVAYSSDGSAIQADFLFRRDADSSGAEGDDER